jgi:U3 small nucleolar RNA-associated protein MPP10
MAPIITVEHTLSIEDMIKKRILAEDWDDVVPRELPDIGMSKRNGELPEVSQEKSKLSLGELYEREYLKKVTGYDKDAIEKETEEEKAKSEMKMLFANLCSKLDALSNYHFAPRPVADEAEVKSTATPAVAMEEILPLHVSDSQAVAPEEVYAKKKGREGILRGESEFDQVRY